MTMSWTTRSLLALMLLYPTLKIVAQTAPADEPPDLLEVTEEAEEEEQAGASPLEDSPLIEAASRRKVVAPWLIRVYGQTYLNFTNEGAERVLSDWLTNALIETRIFQVVNREEIRAVLSEHAMRVGGYSEDFTLDQFAEAGKLKSVDYILLGNFKNLGGTTEVDFKLLDVVNTSYYTDFRMNFTVPFNPSIEQVKGLIDRVIAALAKAFPLEARIETALSPRTVLLGVGSDGGIRPGLPGELTRIDSGQTVHGSITRVDGSTSVVTLTDHVINLDLGSGENFVGDLFRVARITILPGPEAILADGRARLQRATSLDREKRVAEALEEVQGARRIFEEGIDKYGHHAQIQAHLARSCWRLHDYECTVRAFRAALALEPQDKALLREAATAMLEAGRYVEVLRELSGRVDSPELGLVLGQACQILGYVERAEDLFKEAFRADTANPEPHLRLGVLAALRGDFEEADRELKAAQEAETSSAEVELTARAYSLVKEGEEDILSGLESSLRSAERKRDFAALGTGAEILLVDRRHWQASLNLAERSLEINPPYLRGRMLIARALAAGGRTQEALAHLEEAMSLHPNNISLLLLSADLFSASKMFDRAEQSLLQAKDLSVKEWRPAEELADHYFQRELYLKAVSEYQEALQLAKEGEDQPLTKLLMKLGRAAVFANQHATGQPYLERCVEMSPDNKECRYYLGLCYYEDALAESDSKAIVHLKTVGSEYADSFHYLGVLFDRRKEFQTALAWYHRCRDSNCSFRDASQTRIDEIESVSGTVTSVALKKKEASLDIGRIHGVIPSAFAVVVSLGKVTGLLRIEEVKEETSVAKLLKGKPLTGQVVRIKPSAPKELSVKKHPKKGALLRWTPNPEPEVARYAIIRAEVAEGPWEELKKVGGSQHEWVDKSVKADRSYHYRIIALTARKQESSPSKAVSFSMD